MAPSGMRPITHSGMSVAFVAVIYLGGVLAGGYAIALFMAAEHKNAQMTRTTQQPLGSQAVVVGILAGIGPLGGNMVEAIEILDLQKSAWRMTSFAVLLVFGGFAIWHFSGKAEDRWPAIGGPAST
jgi:hypothetical protein